MARAGISEILDKVSKETKPDEKVQILLKNDSPVLRGLLKLAFNKPKWLLPEGKPPFKLNDFPGQQGNLYAEWKRMYLFLEGGNPNLKPIKREYLFIQMLETLDPADSDLLCNIKDGKMPYKTVTKNLVEKAWPDLFKE